MMGAAAASGDQNRAARCATAVCVAEGALGGMTSLLAAVGSGGAATVDAAVPAAAALALLTRIPAIAARVVSTEGMLPALVAALGVPTSAAAYARAAGAVVGAGGSSSSDAVFSLDVGRQLSASWPISADAVAAAASSASLVAHVASAVGNIAAHAASANVLATAPEVLPAMLRLLRSDRTEVREMAAGTARNLALTAVGRCALLKSPGFLKALLACIMHDGGAGRPASARGGLAAAAGGSLSPMRTSWRGGSGEGAEEGDGGAGGITHRERAVEAGAGEAGRHGWIALSPTVSPGRGGTGTRATAESCGGHGGEESTSVHRGIDPNAVADLPSSTELAPAAQSRAGDVPTGQSEAAAAAALRENHAAAGCLVNLSSDEGCLDTLARTPSVVDVLTYVLRKHGGAQGGIHGGTHGGTQGVTDVRLRRYAVAVLANLSAHPPWCATLLLRHAAAAEGVAHTLRTMTPPLAGEASHWPAGVSSAHHSQSVTRVAAATTARTPADRSAPRSLIQAPVRRINTRTHCPRAHGATTGAGA